MGGQHRRAHPSSEHSSISAPHPFIPSPQGGGGARNRDMANWAPRAGQSRQKDRSRANARGRRIRHDPTPTEKRFWSALRQLNRDGAHFRRQLTLDDWVFDFGDLSTRLLIELDGGVHDRLPGVAERDKRKDDWAAANRFQLLRFSNDRVWSDLDAMIAAIRQARWKDAVP